MEDKIYSYFHGAMTRDERLALLREAEMDGELRSEFIRQYNLLALIDLAPQEGDAEAAAKDFSRLMRVHKYIRLRKIALTGLRYAAAVAAAVIITLFATRKQQDVKMLELYAPAGQRLCFTLEDGTALWLNSKTRLLYPSSFSLTERRISIEGEAYIEVAKDPLRPLIVALKGAEVKAVGTVFNVNAYPENSEAIVSLIEGDVQVSRLQADERRETLALTPDKQAHISANGFSITDITEPDNFLWRDGVYSFENRTFEAIARKLEIYYDITIVIEDETVRKWIYTVKFRQRDSIDDIMRLMQRIHPFRMHKDNEKNRITIYNN